MVVHVFALDFESKKLMVEVEGPEDWTPAARLANACEKARRCVPLIKNENLRGHVYLGTQHEVEYIL